MEETCSINIVIQMHRCVLIHLFECDRHLVDCVQTMANKHVKIGKGHKINLKCPQCK